MVRSELLRAKSLHAEVAYLQDLKRVGDAKRVVDERSLVLKEKQRQFWSEATKDAHIPTQLDRMRRAHSQLQEAHAKHNRATDSLKAGLETLSGSQRRIEVLDKLIGKAQRIRANQVESRLSDEVADLVTTSRAVINLRNAALNPNPTVTTLQQQPAPQPTPIIQSPSIQAPAINGPAQINISNVSVSSIQNQPSLSLTCCMGQHGLVGLQITRGETGGLKVAIDPAVSSIASGVMRDKTAIQSRLRALGIKVDTLDIATPDTTSGASKRKKNSANTAKDDEDENVIA